MGIWGGKREKTLIFDQSQRFQIRTTLKKLTQRNLFKIFIIFLSIKKLTHRCMSKSTHCHLSCLFDFPFIFTPASILSFLYLTVTIQTTFLLKPIARSVNHKYTLFKVRLHCARP